MGALTAKQKRHMAIEQEKNVAKFIDTLMFQTK